MSPTICRPFCRKFSLGSAKPPCKSRRLCLIQRHPTKTRSINRLYFPSARGRKWESNCGRQFSFGHVRGYNSHPLCRVSESWADEPPFDEPDHFRTHWSPLSWSTPFSRLCLSCLSKVHGYDPVTRQAALQSAATNKLLMRRYAIVEKARDADVFGILVGTLGVGSPPLPLPVHRCLDD